MPALRHPDPPGVVHEPVELQLPDLPAATEGPTVVTRRVVALVSGDVQGVGYRWFVRGLAGERGLAGSATNLADGRVEVVLEGPDDDVRAVVDALTGPGAAGAPRDVALTEQDPVGDEGFTTG